MALRTKRTNRGFVRGEFKDQYDLACSIQESSLATEACIWLGVDEKRMHLTRKMVKKLLPLLEMFAETGMLK